MDEIDLAQQNDELFRENALRAHFASLKNASPVNHLCCDCGEKIEKARLKALPNAVRCIDCQEKHERRERHG